MDMRERLETVRHRFYTIERDVLSARLRLRDVDRAATRASTSTLEVEEIWASMRFAETPLDRDEIEARVRRDAALGGHKLEAYISVADYAEGAAFVRAAPMPSRRRGFLTVEEIIALHARIGRRTIERPGALRETSLRAFPGGMVPAPAWSIPAALAAYVERHRLGPSPGESELAWVAQAHARYERIHPFDSANGRVGRAIVNLLLRRCGFLPFVVRPRDATNYIEALRAADSRNPWPLALLLARSLARSYTVVLASAPDTGELRPLSEFADGAQRAALYKAAQRGRLQAFRRDGRLYTSAMWIAKYRSVSSKATQVK